MRLRGLYFDSSVEAAMQSMELKGRSVRETHRRIGTSLRFSLNANLKPSVRQRLSNAFGHLLCLLRIDCLVRMLFTTVANGGSNNRIHLMLISQLPTLRAALILLESTPINRRQLKGSGPAASAGPAVPFST